MQYTESYEVVDKSIDAHRAPIPFQSEAAANEYLDAMTGGLMSPYNYEVIRVLRLVVSSRMSAGRARR